MYRIEGEDMQTQPSLEEAKQSLVDDFALFEDWNDRYEYIISLGSHMPEYPDELRTEDHEVHGCQSMVWMAARMDSGVINFQADSDAMITKGLVALMVNLHSGRSPDEILSSNLEFLKDIGLEEHLTPSRVNGLVAMFNKIREHAVRFKAMEESGTAS